LYAEGAARLSHRIDELVTLIAAVRSGETCAYEPVVRRFQDMAVAYAFALLGDWQLAEDAAQEAFIAAYCYPGSYYFSYSAKFSAISDPAVTVPDYQPDYTCNRLTNEYLVLRQQIQHIVDNSSDGTQVADRKCCKSGDELPRSDHLTRFSERRECRDLRA
jgi:hypothetical protein